MSRPTVPVVAGVLYRHDGAFLLSSRPEGKPYAGYWEFAGGKVEAGESDLVALQREFQEELGICICHATPWLTRIHDYEHARVRLRFYRIAASDWQGELQAREGQQWCWCTPEALNTPDAVAPMLPANAPIFAALRIPTGLSGSLNQGFCAGAHGQPFCVLPWRHIHSPTAPNAVWASAGEFEEARRHGGDVPLWVLADAAAPLPEADALIWPVRTADDAARLLAFLHNGAAMPVLPLLAPQQQAEYGAALQQAGAHGILTNTAA